MAAAGALACPNCGGAVQLHGYAQTLNVVCERCLSVLDARTPELQILQQAQAREHIQPLIPLGNRGTFEGIPFEAIGFQQRTIDVDGVLYSWREYLLFNPYYGYRYLSEYDGHWNYIRSVRALPVRSTSAIQRPQVSYRGTTYKHFQHAEAETTYVIGEFPWQVRIGDRVTVDDYVSPPYMLSAETVPGETTWSAGTYKKPEEIAAAFRLPGALPQPKGVFANQPSPFDGKLLGMWALAFLLMCGLAVISMLLLAGTRREQLFEQRYSYASNSRFGAAFVTSVFDVRGDARTVDVGIDADIREDAAFTVSLINDETGQAWDRGDALDDSRANISFAGVPAGRYYLRVEPELDDDPYRPLSMNYTLRITQGGVAWFPLLIGFLFLLIPPMVQSLRAASFESTRWADSDYGSPYSASSTSEDEDE